MNYYYTFCRELFIYLILISNYVTEIKSWLSKCYNISDRYCNLDFSIILIVISSWPRNKLGVLLGFEKKDNSTFVGIPIGTPLGFQNPSFKLSGFSRTSKKNSVALNSRKTHIDLLRIPSYFSKNVLVIASPGYVTLSSILWPYSYTKLGVLYATSF